jgi:sentrin-specific protease 1
VLIPINHNNSHWTAAAINFRRKRIESYDSMGMDRENVYKVSDISPSLHAPIIINRRFQRLREYVDAEHRNKKKKPFDFGGWEDWLYEVRIH